MAFLTAEQVKAVRLRKSERFRIERLEKDIVIVLMSGNKAFEIREQQADVSGAKGQRALFLFMIQSACADESGSLLTAEDAEQLLDVLSLDEVTKLINKIGESIGLQVGKAKGPEAGETSSSGSASPSAGPTPTS